VALVIGGDRATIKEILRRVKYPEGGLASGEVSFHRTQTVIIDGSGGAADCIAYAWKLINYPEAGHTEVRDLGLLTSAVFARGACHSQSE
jgi:hypothetical protein